VRPSEIHNFPSLQSSSEYEYKDDIAAEGEEETPSEDEDQLLPGHRDKDGTKLNRTTVPGVRKRAFQTGLADWKKGLGLLDVYEKAMEGSVGNNIHDAGTSTPDDSISVNSYTSSKDSAHKSHSASKPKDWATLQQERQRQRLNLPTEQDRLEIHRREREMRSRNRKR